MTDEKTPTELRAEIDARKAEIDTRALAIYNASVWLTANALKLATIGVGDYGTALIGNVNDDGLTIYVYGDEKKQTQTVAAFRATFGGEWERDSLWLISREFSDTFAVSLLVNFEEEATTTAPTGAGSR